MSKAPNKTGKADKAKVKAKRQAKVQAKKQAGAGSNLSGVGLTIAEMSDLQFTGHLGRVLNRMKVKGVSMDSLKAASLRIKARRQEAIAV